MNRRRWRVTRSASDRGTACPLPFDSIASSLDASVSKASVRRSTDCCKDRDGSCPLVARVPSLGPATWLRYVVTRPLDYGVKSAQTTSVAQAERVLGVQRLDVADGSSVKSSLAGRDFV